MPRPQRPARLHSRFSTRCRSVEHVA